MQDLEVFLDGRVNIWQQMALLKDDRAVARSARLQYQARMKSCFRAQLRLLDMHGRNFVRCANIDIPTHLGYADMVGASSRYEWTIYVGVFDSLLGQYILATVTSNSFQCFLCSLSICQILGSAFPSLLLSPTGATCAPPSAQLRGQAESAYLIDSSLTSCCLMYPTPYLLGSSSSPPLHFLRG